MTAKTEFVSLRNFDLIGALDDEQDMLEEFGNYDGYVCDAISELADSYIPIYNADIWKNASDISEHIEEAIAQGLAPVDSRDVDLMRIFQAGYYQYYTESLYNNLDTLAFNFIADKVNEFLNTLDDTSSIDIDEIEQAIDDETNNYDNNNTFDNLNDTANDIIKRIESEEFVA